MGRFDAVTKDPGGLPAVARLLVPLLGVFFLVYPIQVLFASDPARGQVSGALGVTALFAGIFLWLMWTREPLQLVPAERQEALKVRAAIALLAVLAGVLGFGLGPEWRMLFFYHLNVAAGIMLPRRDAYAVIAGIVLLTLVAGASSGLAWLAFPALAIGLWSTTFVGQVAAVAELRAAREGLARLAVSEERLRFARDLHDLLGHSLSAIALKTALASRLLPDLPGAERAQKEIRDAEGVARGALREMREAVAGYRRPALAEELEGARGMLEAAGIAPRIEDHSGILPGASDAVLAWAVREGVTNVIRHSGAGRCEIRLGRNASGIEAEIADDGRGPVGQGATGSGLAGLAERVVEEGGDLEAGPGPGGGFRLRVILPLAKEVAGSRTSEETATSCGEPS